MFVVKVPGINGNGKTDGCKIAGIEILKSFNEISSNEQGREIGTKFLDLEEIHLDSSNLEFSNKLIYKNAFKIFEDKPKVVFFGGDHSVSFSLVRAFFDYCKMNDKEPCLIVLDASPNLKKKEEKFPKNNQWLRSLIESGFSVENILLVGVRDFEPEEISFIKENKIKMVPMNQIFESISDATDAITEFSNGRELYVSLDVSVVDPVFAPISDGKIGGLNPRELVYLIQRLNKIKNLRAVDIVEVNVEKDLQRMGVKLGAKILSELV